ncbi:hypothetical protein GCM10027299_03800 [Larkinella ripae]
MHTNQSYADYLQRISVSARPAPAASLEFLLLDRALDRHHQRELAKLSQFTTAFDWQLTRNYEKALRDGFTLIVANTAQSILWVSHRFFAMTGYTSREAVGQTPRFLQGPGTDPAQVRLLSDALAQAHHTPVAHPIHHQLVNYRKDRTPYLCDIEIDPIRNRQGELSHFIAVEKAI